MALLLLYMPNSPLRAVMLAGSAGLFRAIHPRMLRCRKFPGRIWIQLWKGDIASVPPRTRNAAKHCISSVHGIYMLHSWCANVKLQAAERDIVRAASEVIYYPYPQSDAPAYILRVYQCARSRMPFPTIPTTPTPTSQCVPFTATSLFPNTMTRSSSGLKVFSPPRGAPAGVPKTSWAHIFQLGSIAHTFKASGLKLGCRDLRLRGRFRLGRGYESDTQAREKVGGGGRTYR